MTSFAAHQGTAWRYSRTILHIGEETRRRSLQTSLVFNMIRAMTISQTEPETKLISMDQHQWLASAGAKSWKRQKLNTCITCEQERGRC